MSQFLKKIAYVVPNLGEYGGIQTYATDQCDRLSDQFLITPLNWEQDTPRVLELAARLLPPAIVSRRPPHQGKIYPGEQRPIASGADLVHYWHFRAAVKAPRRPGQFMVVTCHGSEILRSRLPRYHYLAAKHVLAVADAIVTPSNYTKQYIEAEFGISAAMIHVLHPGISRLHLASVPTPRKPLDRRTRNIGVIARLVPRKNILATIEAAEAAAERYEHRLILHVAGDGPLRDQVVRRLRASSIECHYYGPIGETEKWNSFLPMLDAFVLPALSSERDIEGFGISYLEANAVGVPVVATPLGGAVDAVAEGQSGIFARSPAPADVATAILSVLEDSGLPTRALEWAQQFRADQTATAFGKLYEALLTSGAPALGVS